GSSSLRVRGGAGRRPAAVPGRAAGGGAAGGRGGAGLALGTAKPGRGQSCSFDRAIIGHGTRHRLLLRRTGPSTSPGGPSALIRRSSESGPAGRGRKPNRPLTGTARGAATGADRQHGPARLRM